MKKADQMIINENVINIMEAVNNMIHRYDVDSGKQLLSCNARVYRTRGFYVLQSYNTYVAAIDDNGNCWDFLRYVYGYTATSAQHISKFAREYGNGAKYTYKEV